MGLLEQKTPEELEETFRESSIYPKVRVNATGTRVYGADGKLRSFHYTGSAASNRQPQQAVWVGGRSVGVHRLVAECFVPNPLSLTKKFVLHKDGNTVNNHYQNLMWGDSTDLYRLQKKHGRFNLTPSYGNRNNSKLTDETAQFIAKKLEEGETGAKLAKVYGVSEMAISRIRSRYVKKKQVQVRREEAKKKK